MTAHGNTVVGRAHGGGGRTRVRAEWWRPNIEYNAINTTENTYNNSVVVVVVVAVAGTRLGPFVFKSIDDRENTIYIVTRLTTVYVRIRMEIGQFNEENQISTAYTNTTNFTIVRQYVCERHFKHLVTGRWESSAETERDKNLNSRKQLTRPKLFS